MLKAMVLSALCLGLCATLSEAKTTVTTQPFGKIPDGTPVEMFTLSDGTVEAQIISYGGIVVSLKTPDRNGNSADVVLGFDDVDGYYANGNNPGSAFFGRSSGVTEIASPRERSRWTARRIILPSTTHRTHCMAARTASTTSCGKRKRSRTASS